jgi:hypothetical protein
MSPMKFSTGTGGSGVRSIGPRPLPAEHADANRWGPRTPATPTTTVSAGWTMTGSAPERTAGATMGDSLKPTGATGGPRADGRPPFGRRPPGSGPTPETPAPEPRSPPKSAAALPSHPVDVIPHAYHPGRQHEYHGARRTLNLNLKTRLRVGEPEPDAPPRLGKAVRNVVSGSRG